MEEPWDIQDLWGEEDREVEEGPPVLPTERLQDPIRHSLPTERLALWLLRGDGMLAIPLIALSMVIPASPFFLLAFYVLLKPMLGPRPLSRPFRVSLVLALSTLLTALFDPLYTYIVPWYLAIGYRDPQPVWIASEIQHFLREFTSLTGCATLIGFTSLAFLLTRWCEKRYPWLEVKHPKGRWRSYLCAVALVTPLVAFFTFQWAINEQLSQMEGDWLLKAQRHQTQDKLPTLPESRELSFSNPLFSELMNSETFRLRFMEARELPEEQFLALIRELNERLKEPSFQPTTADVQLFETLAQRIRYMQTPKREIAEFTLLVLSLRNRFDFVFEAYQLEWALRHHTAPFLVKASGEELKAWKTHLGRLSVRPLTRAELDALVWRTLQERYSMEPGYKTKKSRRYKQRSLGEPLVLFGLSLPISLETEFLKIEEKLLLLDYDRRREQPVPFRETHQIRRLFSHTPPETWWFASTYDHFYQLLFTSSPAEILDRDHRLLKTVHDLRAEKLRTGLYPPQLSEDARQEFHYSSTGSTATLESTAVPRSMVYGKWEFE